MSEQTRTVSKIAEELKASADALDPSARLLGNVTAGEVGKLCLLCIDAIAPRPRLAPEHVAILRDMLNFCQEYTRDHPIPRAIRAALAALGEDPL